MCRGGDQLNVIYSLEPDALYFWSHHLQSSFIGSTCPQQYTGELPSLYKSINLLSWSIASVVHRFNLYRHQRISPASIFMKSDIISTLFFFIYKNFLFFLKKNSIRREKLFNENKRKRFVTQFVVGEADSGRSYTHSQLAIEINEAVAKNMNLSLYIYAQQPTK